MDASWRAVLFISCSHFVFHKHSRSVTKSRTNDVWSPFNLKIVVGYFEINEAANRRSTPLFNAEKDVVACLFTLFTWDDDPSKVNESWRRTTYFIFHLGWSLLINGLFTLSTCGVSSEVSNVKLPVEIANLKYGRNKQSEFVKTVCYAARGPNISHLVIYSPTRYTKCFNEWVYSSRMLARRVSDLTGPSSGAFYKLYLQILYVVIRVE